MASTDLTTSSSNIEHDLTMENTEDEPALQAESEENLKKYSDNKKSSSTIHEDHKRTIDDAFINKMKSLVEKLRLENATLKKSLDTERSGIRALKAQNEAAIRNLKTEAKKREELLEKQLRSYNNIEKSDENIDIRKSNELRRLTSEILSLKVANKSLQDKLKVAQSAESARAAELRAQVARHNALELAARKDARAQCHKLLEEIKSKERIIIQLKREAGRAATADNDKAQIMDCRRTATDKKLRVDQNNEKSSHGDLNTENQHRKETFFREVAPSEADSAVSSAPSSLSPQPLNDMWSCDQCRLAEERASTAARECTRLADALRDARDQLELMEFRLLELEDATPDKAPRDNLTDTDSGCVSPGSRIKDSASPELKRMDSGYKSPNSPSSPCNVRKNLPTNEDFKEDFAKAQVLADILDRNSETSDSLKSNPVRDHLEQMLLNAASIEDRTCLEQVIILLYNFQALSSSVSEEDYQIKPRKPCDLRTKSDTEIPSQRTHKAIATVSPYTQHRHQCDSLDGSINNEERKTTNILQESGIFEEVDTESKSTQTDVNETFECSGELNTEIQRLNSIREKLERQGLGSRNLSNNDGDSLECRCVKLGKKHKQYYERRLKFLEGKISIYEAAQDVKEAKLAERLQKEFLLENRIQELESQLIELHEKYERLEEDCCELEEIENDTRLHWQQLEMDYELCSAQLMDMREERECSRAQAERLTSELRAREAALKTREAEAISRLTRLQRAVPALIAFNVIKALGANVTPIAQRALMTRIGPFSPDTKALIAQVKSEKEALKHIHSDNTTVAFNFNNDASPLVTSDLQRQLFSLIEEKGNMHKQAEATRKTLENRIAELESELETVKRQLDATVLGAESKIHDLEEKITKMEHKLAEEEEHRKTPVDPITSAHIESLRANEKELKSRVAELERRETAYLEMLTQADDMWAEMEGGYKTKIQESQATETALRGQVRKQLMDIDSIKKSMDPLKKRLKELEESESVFRYTLEKAERDKEKLARENESLLQINANVSADLKKSETNFQILDNNFRTEIEKLRKTNKDIEVELVQQKDHNKKLETSFMSDLDSLRKDLNRVYKNGQELETTNSELKEEVESLERQLSLTQKALTQCKRRCDEKIKTLSHELSIKTEELEEIRSETLRQSLQASRVDLKPEKTEYVDEGYTICTAVPKKTDYGRMHHSLSYFSSEPGCSCPTLRSQLVGQLIEDLFERIHNTIDDDLTKLCKELVHGKSKGDITAETKAKIVNYLLMAISKELVRSIGDADAKTDTEEWQRAISSMTYTVPNFTTSEGRGNFSSLRLEGNAGVLSGAARLASVSCACAAARLCTAAPELADTVKACQEEVLDHSDVKIMEEQLANAIESIVNCPSCALGTNTIVWSTDV